MSTDPRIEAAAKMLHTLERYAPWDGESADLRAAFIEDAARVLGAIDDAATINTVEGLDALAPRSRVVLADTLLLRMAEIVDETVWRDLSNASPFDRDEIRMLFANGWKARVIHCGTE